MKESLSAAAVASYLAAALIAAGAAVSFIGFWFICVVPDMLWQWTDHSAPAALLGLLATAAAVLLAIGGALHALSEPSNKE